MANQDCELILRQHEIIREKMGKIIAQIDILRKEPSSSRVDLAELEEDTKKLLQIIEAHSHTEEQILLPILAQMYDSQPEILRYVVDDHVVIQDELSELLNDSIRLADHLPKIKSLLNRVNIHFVEEESGLLPLVQMYLQSNQAMISK